MPTWVETGLDLVEQFTGTGDAGEHALVLFGVGAIFWSLLLILARTDIAREQLPHHFLLTLGISLALSRELLMVAVRITEAYGWLMPQLLRAAYPPLEHALSTIGLAIVASVYAWKLTADDRWRWYINGGIAVLSVVYVATALWWAPTAWANPDVDFGHAWTGWAFHAVATVAIGGPLVTLRLAPPGLVKRLVATALALFTWWEFLEFFDAALGERRDPILATVGHTLYLIALPVLTYGFFRELSRASARKTDHLEQLLADRTSELGHATSQVEAANGRLSRQSRIDSLTGIANRNAFDEECATEWARGRRNALPLSLLVVDIDYFKGINDGFGHAVGDELLRRAAATIVEATGRSADVVARFGGDEFAVLLPDTDVAGTAAVAKRIVEAIRAIRLESIAETRVTASVGGATLVPTDTVDTSALLLAADEALCIVKDAGRNGLHIVDRRRSLPV